MAINWRFFFRFCLPEILCLIVICMMGIGWWRDCQRHRLSTQRAEARIQQLEEEGVDIGLASLPFSAHQAIGPPDEVGNNYSSHSSWFPSRNDSNAEWLILDYEQEWDVAEVSIHEAYSMGHVSQVSILPSQGDELVIWSGKDPTPQPTEGSARRGVFRVTPTLNAGVMKTKRVKLYFVDAQKLGCFAIDAVGICDLSGFTHWAVGATASSSYGQANGQLYRSGRISFMQEKWYPDGHMDADF